MSFANLSNAKKKLNKSNELCNYNHANFVVFQELHFECHGKRFKIFIGVISFYFLFFIQNTFSTTEKITLFLHELKDIR